MMKISRKNLNRKIFQKIDMSHAHDSCRLQLVRGCYSYCEIRTHATLKATQAQGHKKEVEERNIK
jgi:hypothetical protein